MTSREVHNYKLLCITENVWKYDYWSTEHPTACRDNPAHTIGDPIIIDTIASSEVVIKETTVVTGGNFQMDSLNMVCPPGPSTHQYNNFDNSINVFTATCTTTADHTGDTIDVVSAKDTVIGAITVPVLVGDTTINVSPTVFDHLMVGYRVNLFDGTNEDNCGTCTEVNKTAGTIVLSVATTHSFSPLTPTYVRFSVPFTRRPLMFAVPQTYKFGGSKIGGTYLPRGVTSTVIYVNNGLTTKYLTFYYETDY